MTAAADTLQRVEVGSFQWWIREGTSDLTAIREVAEKDCYFTRAFQPEPGERWLDAGANVGAFAVVCAAKGAHVTAYEPEPENAALARRNLRENELRPPHARVVEKAIAFEGGFASLGLSKSAWRHSLLRTKGTLVQVPVVAFADAIKDMDGAKLDIEGAEIEILRETTDYGSLRKLVFEWHFDHCRPTDVYLDVLDRLAAHWTEVKGPRVKPGIDYTFFPPAALVRCTR